MKGNLTRKSKIAFLCCVVMFYVVRAKAVEFFTLHSSFFASFRS